MRSLKLIIFILSALLIDIGFARAECINVKNESGKLEMSATGIRRGKMQSTCWRFVVPSGSTATFNVTKLTADRTEGVTVYLDVKDERIVPPILNSNNRVLRKTEDITVTHVVENHSTFFPVTSVFEATYAIKADKENETDDKDETDEGKETDKENETNEEIRAKLIAWLKEQRFNSGAWGKDSPKAITAIHLATGTNFKDDSEEKQMAQNMKIELLLRKTDAEIDDLTGFTNALIAICEEPNEFEFRGKIIVELLQEEIKKEANKDNAAAYLALCTDGSSEWPDTAIDTLVELLKSEDTKQQAFAIMAFACERKRNEEFNKTAAFKAVTKAVRNIKDQQRREGHFGDLTSTIDATQALLSWGERNSKGWDYEKALQYLLKRHRDDTTFNFEQVCNLLPILNGKSLVDVSCKNEYFADKNMNTSDDKYRAAKLLDNRIP